MFACLYLPRPANAVHRPASIGHRRSTLARWPIDDGRSTMARSSPRPPRSPRALRSPRDPVTGCARFFAACRDAWRSHGNARHQRARQPHRRAAIDWRRTAPHGGRCRIARAHRRGVDIDCRDPARARARRTDRGGARHEAATLAPLPLRVLAQLALALALGSGPTQAQSLKPTKPDVEQLPRWGLRTLGDLASLPSAELSARLGQPGLRWQRWARGEEMRPLVPAGVAEQFEESLDLEWPIDGLEPLSFVLARLLDPLCERLERSDRGVGRPACDVDAGEPRAARPRG